MLNHAAHIQYDSSPENLPTNSSFRESIYLKLRKIRPRNYRLPRLHPNRQAGSAEPRHPLSHHFCIRQRTRLIPYPRSVSASLVETAWCHFSTKMNQTIRSDLDLMAIGGKVALPPLWATDLFLKPPINRDSQLSSRIEPSDHKSVAARKYRRLPGCHVA